PAHRRGAVPRAGRGAAQARDAARAQARRKPRARRQRGAAADPRGLAMTTPETAAEIREGAEPSGAWAQSAKLAFRFLFLAVILAGVGWLFSNLRQVPPESRALVYRFGQLVRQQGSGMLLAWPQPVERIVILPTEDRQLEFRIDKFEPDSSLGAD